MSFRLDFHTGGQLMLKRNGKRFTAFAALGVMSMGTTLLPSMTSTARADADTTKKVAIGAGIVTGYGLIKGKGRVATVGGVATAGSYLLYRNQKKKEEAKRRTWYQRRYGRNWRSHYKSGT
jgi:hypothetical protein